MSTTWVKDDFTVVWDCAKQHYTISKGMKIIRVVYRFGEAKPYLT